MPNRQAGEYDDTASIRSSVSSIFPSFSSVRKGRRRLLSNLWVFTNNSRTNTQEPARTPERPQTSAGHYPDTPTTIVDGRKTPTGRSATPWHTHPGSSAISSLPPILDDDSTTPTSAQTSIPSTPRDVSGISSLRRNGKLLRTRPSVLDSPVGSIPPSPALTPKTGLFEKALMPPVMSLSGKDGHLNTSKAVERPSLPLKDVDEARKGPDRLMPTQSSIPRRRGKEVKGDTVRSLRTAPSKEGPFSIAQEVEKEEGEEEVLEPEKTLPGLCTTDMDDLIDGLNPKRMRSKGDLRSDSKIQHASRIEHQSFTKSARSRRTSSRDLHSIAAELSGGKVVPVRSASKPQPLARSIDDIVRRHANEAPEVFGLSRKAVDSIAIYQDHPVNDTLDGVLLTRDLMLERLESREPSGSSDDTHVGPPVPPKPDGYYAATTSSDTRVSLGSSTSWESLKRKLDNDDDPDRAIDKYLKSHRLNRIVTLSRPGQAGQVLSVAEVGDPKGYPVLVFLGLGCVRYLIALYDEVARADGIRLICIDRWGLGKSQEVSPELRGLLEWAGAVEEVMDQMDISKFGILAHSAGVPYALATTLKMKERVVGAIHLLAPWVNIEVDGGYKWLKYVPSNVIKTAQATERKFYGWKLGSLPVTPSGGIGYTTPKSSRIVMGTASGYFVGRQGRPSLSPLTTPIYLNETPTRRWSSSKVNLGISPRSEAALDTPSRPPVSPLVRPKSSASRLARSLSKYSDGKPGQDFLQQLRDGQLGQIMTSSYARSNTSDTNLDQQSVSKRPSASRTGSAKIVPARTTSLPSVDLERLDSRTPSTTSCSSSMVPLAGESSLATAILRASHAEALQGATADLMSILGRDSKDWGFSYTHIEHPCQVWLGEKDDKIGERGVRWMEREMKECQVEMIPGEGHNLMTSSKAMLTIFARLQSDVKAWSIAS